MLGFQRRKNFSHSNEDEKEDQDQNLILLGLRAPKITLNRRKFLFYPTDTIKVMVWDLLISVILLLTCFVTPFNLAFTEEVDQVIWYVVVNYSIDFLFLIDIFINFNTAYQNELYETIDDRQKIAANYIKGWFLIDLLAIIPFELLIQMTQGDQDSSGEEFNKMVRMTRISKLYKLVKITRLLRLLKLMKKQNNQVIDKIGSSLKISQGFERLSFFFLILLLLCHFVCCLWIFVARNF